MQNKNIYIGIDLGTSSVKVIAADASGAIRAEQSESYKVSYPEKGYSEQNPADWFKATIKALSRLNVKNVKGIAVGGQMHGLVALDRGGNVIRPCILWNDGRAFKETATLNSFEKLPEWTGNIAFAGFTAPKILWLKENEPENFARTDKIMLPKDYLVYMLTGEFVTDYSDASGTLLLDVANKRWSREMLEICGLNENKLPRLCESYSVAGTLKKEIADKFGWTDVKVAVGAGDNAAAAAGTGTVFENDCNISLGTSGTVFVACDKFMLPKNNALHGFCHANGKWHLMGCILSAASANKWWIEDILNSDYSAPEKAIEKLGKNDVFFLPYLTGERCPHNDVNARGAFIGLSADTTREEMSLAVLEGVAFALKDCLEIGVKVNKSTVCGGGAKSALWLKILANVLNLPLYRVETEQGPAYGAAMLAMTACGEFDGLESASKLVVKTLAQAPEQGLVEPYAEKYKKYKKLYPLLREWYEAAGK